MKQTNKSTPSLQQNKDFVIALRKHTFTSLTIARNETSHPDSLDELVYHQTKYGHLMIVDDALFHAFVELQKIVTPLLTPENLHQQKQQLFSHIMHGYDHGLHTTLPTTATWSYHSRYEACHWNLCPYLPQGNGSQIRKEAPGYEEAGTQKAGPTGRSCWSGERWWWEFNKQIHSPMWYKCGCKQRISRW